MRRDCNLWLFSAPIDAALCHFGVYYRQMFPLEGLVVAAFSRQSLTAQGKLRP